MRLQRWLRRPLGHAHPATTGTWPLVLCSALPLFEDELLVAAAQDTASALKGTAAAV